TFDIDANGILHVSAKDKATGKEQKIVIKASSGLSDEEVQRMIRDAEAHAEEDHKAAALVHARNQADNLVHQVRKTVADLGDKLDGDEKARVEEAIKATEEAAKGDDQAAIEAATAALTAASHGLAEKMYGGGEQSEPPAGATAGGRAGDDVVDAEFKEVRDDK
ncbi:MAG TPA: Hsp70 family protein, partial [Immundisolibacter sp.]